MRTRIRRNVERARYHEPSLVLSEHDENTAGKLRTQRQEVVARAAHAAHTNSQITRIHVVLNERPAYEEITKFRQVAEEQELDMTVDGSGTVSMWRHDQAGLRGTD